MKIRLGAFLLLAAVPVSGASGRAATHRVPSDFPTLQAAFDAASNGDTVIVARGTYPGPFTLRKTLKVAGEDAVLLGGDPIFTVTSSARAGTAIQGFTFQRGAKALVIDGARGVDVLDCRFIDNGGDQLSFENAGGTVRNCFFRNAGDDNIDIDGASDPLLEHNTLLNAADDNIEMRFQPYVGKPTLKTVIRHNYIAGAKHGDGIQLIDYKGVSNRTVHIERNVITRARWAGIGSMEDGHTKQGDFPDAPRGSPQVEKVYVLHNTIVGNPWGVTGGHRMLLLNNLIAECGKAAVRRVRGTSALLNTALWNNAADYDEAVASVGDVKQAPALDANHRLQGGSPCVDAGLASATWNGETVSAGDFTGPAPDLGAFEFSKDALPSVTVSAADGGEPSKAGSFTVLRSGSTREALTVAYVVGGSATPGPDYAALPGTVTIPAGSAGTTLSVAPADDAEAEGVETVELALRPAPAYTLGNPFRATLTIADDDGKRPEVTVAASDPTGAETGAEPAAFTITRTGPVKEALTVRFTLGGEAVNGVDYARVGSAVTFPAGASSSSVTMVPMDDDVAVLGRSA